MDIFLNILLTIITTGGLGIINYIIAESLNAVDSNQQNTNREKGISALLTTVDLLIYLTLDTAIRYILHNIFAEIFAAVITIFLSIALSIKLSKPLSDFFHIKIINKEREKNNLIPIEPSTPWKQITLSGTQPQQAYLYSLNHDPLGFGWIHFVSNDQDSNYSLSLVPFTDDDQKPQPSYEKIIARIQAKKYKEEHDVQQFIDFKQGFIMITSTKNEINADPK